MVGAGVLGLATALELQRGGAQVLLLDPDPLHNASAVAAGMLAPVGEALFDPAAASHYPFLRAAQALWAGFAADHGIEMAEDGLIAPAAYAGEAAALGASVAPLPGQVHIQGDGRVADPVGALKRLRSRFIEAGGVFEARAVQPSDREVETVVLAAGPGFGALAAWAAELAHLVPVKGQIAVLPQAQLAGPPRRWLGGYAVPQAAGVRVGATMEIGVSDAGIEAAAISRLVEGAAAHISGLDTAGAYGEAGVRVQTPDGLPLVGPSRTPGVLLATGARRNGWLLAPLVGRMIAAYCRGEDPGPWAAMLHPGRFDD